MTEFDAPAPIKQAGHCTRCEAPFIADAVVFMVREYVVWQVLNDRIGLCQHETVAVGERCATVKRGAAGFSAWSYATKALNKRIAAAAGKPLSGGWRIHDLRRTMRSGLSRPRVPPHVAELAIGHVRGGVQATYDRFDYADQIQTALARWGEHVAAVVGDRPVGDRSSNVQPLRARCWYLRPKP